MKYLLAPVSITNGYDGVASLPSCGVMGNTGPVTIFDHFRRLLLCRNFTHGRLPFE